MDFAGSKTIDEIDVYSLHDNYTVQNTPTESQTFTLYGLLNFEVQYWNGSAWVTVPGGSVTGNNKVWRKFTFAPITTSKIRVWITSVPDSWSRIVEVEAYSSGATNWLVTDHLGTPRMIIDQTGTLANVKRHDYLPFGEELFAPTGGRSTAQGYGGGDGIRQQFTLKERDVETGLHYFLARYNSSMQGRFTGVDPYDINFERHNTADPEGADTLFRNYISEPQHWNRFAYALNNPLRYVDPDGLLEYETELLGQKIKVKISDNLKSEDGKKLKGDDLKKAQEKIKENINNAIAKINSGRSKLSSEEITKINSMKAIEVRTDIRTPGMNGSTFQMTQRYSETDDQETLVAAFIHESYHAYQIRKGSPSDRRGDGKASQRVYFPDIGEIRDEQ